MVATDQDILDNAMNALNDILQGKVEEFREGSESARTLRILELKATIREFRAMIAAETGNVFRTIVEVDQ